VEVYVPAARAEAFVVLNDNNPSAEDGRTSQLLLADLVSVTVGVPVFAERVEVLFGPVPFGTIEKEMDVGENDSAGGGVTVRVTWSVALAYPADEAITVEVYVPGASPEAFIPNNNDPSSADGRTSQPLFGDLVRLTAGIPVFAESIELLFAVAPF